MGVGVAAGYPQLSGTFTPELWSDKLNVKFYEGTCLTEVCNTDWEGEVLNEGDTVHIRQVPTVTIRKRVKGQKSVRETPTAPKITLNIDQVLDIAEELDQVDKIQNDIDMFDLWTTDASEQAKIFVERETFGAHYADADADNQGATAGKDSQDIDLGSTGAPLQLLKTNIIDFIVDCGTVLDEQNVPDENRWMVLPPWAIGRVKKSDVKDAALMGDPQSVLRKGLVGMIDRFMIFNSNLLTISNDSGGSRAWNAMFGHRSAITFAMQAKDMKKIDNPDMPGEILQGWWVYGRKVVKAQGLGWAYIRK